MRKPLIVIAAIAVIGTLSYCSSSKKTASAAKSVTAYADIAPILESNCAPCHIPSKGGNKKPYDNIANVRADIDDILLRVQLDSTDRRFMPRKKPKLSAETIAILKKWKADGMLEAKP